MAKIKLFNPIQAWLIALCNYAMVVFFAMTLAYWFWIFFKPTPIAAIPPAPPVLQSIVPTIQAGHWFSNTAATQQVQTPTLNLKLVGVYSSTANKPGFAIFKLENGKENYVVVNHEISPGVLLVAVNATSATILQNNQTSEIKLAGVEAK